MMASFATRLDELPRPIWFALAILGFIVWWPLGLAVLAYLVWSRKMACCGFDFGNWRNGTSDTLQDWSRQPRTSGNQAFDEYRTATLQRLEEEQRGFRDFLSRLRTAKDKAEFDQFMAERRAQPKPSTS
jgi:hypothetical protein